MLDILTAPLRSSKTTIIRAQCVLLYGHRTNGRLPSRYLSTSQRPDVEGVAARISTYVVMKGGSAIGSPRRLVEEAAPSADRVSTYE